jgi:probable rRNA maturation factor
VVVLEQQGDEVGRRSLSLFAAHAQRAVGLRGEVNIRVTSNDEIRYLNRRFRHKDKPTDVLSFPSEMPRLAGDIAISVEIAQKNAAELGHSCQTELKILILHGLLHLAGYDHENDRGEMEGKELILRQKFKLPLGLIERTNSGGMKNSSGRTRASTAARKKSGR